MNLKVHHYFHLKKKKKNEKKKKREKEKNWLILSTSLFSLFSAARKWKNKTPGRAIIIFAGALC